MSLIEFSWIIMGPYPLQEDRIGQDIIIVTVGRWVGMGDKLLLHSGAGVIFGQKGI